MWQLFDYASLSDSQKQEPRIPAPEPRGYAFAPPSSDPGGTGNASVGSASALHDPPQLDHNLPSDSTYPFELFMEDWTSLGAGWSMDQPGESLF